MRRGVIVILAMFVVVTGMAYVFAQDRPPVQDPPGGFERPGARDRGDTPERPNRQQRQPGAMQRMGGGPVVMELSGDTLFLVQGTVVHKIDTKTMELEAKKDLALTSAGESAAADEVIKKFDRDGDGIISADEWPGPEAMFKKFDADESGGLDKSELPQDLLDRAKRMGAAKRIPAGPAAIKVGEKSLFIYLGGHIFKLNISDLEVEGSLQLEQQQRPQRDANPMDEERRRQRMEKMEKREKRQRDGQEEGAEKPKKKGDDFGF